MFEPLRVSGLSIYWTFMFSTSPAPLRSCVVFLRRFCDPTFIPSLHLYANMTPELIPDFGLSSNHSETEDHLAKMGDSKGTEARGSSPPSGTIAKLVSWLLFSLLAVSRAWCLGAY
jgi:hypothetical protein